MGCFYWWSNYYVSCGPYISTYITVTTQERHVVPSHSIWQELSSRYAHEHYWVVHDDVIKSKHFPRYWPFVRGIHRPQVNSPHKGQWRGALMFSLICAWINDWVNNREAGGLKRYRAHYDVTVMDWISILNKKVKYITRTHSKLRFIHVCIHNKTKYYKISAYLWNILYIQHTISNYLLYNSINWSLSDYKGIVFHCTHTFSL